MLPHACFTLACFYECAFLDKSREETHAMVCVLYTWLFWACFQGQSGSWYGHLFVLEPSSLLLICSSLFQSSCPLFHCGGEDVAGRGTVSLRLSRVLVAPGTMTLSLVSKPRTISTHFCSGLGSGHVWHWWVIKMTYLNQVLVSSLLRMMWISN